MRAKGFTLIELLVVIAIIAILAAILFPVFAQAKLAAKKVNDLSQLKQNSLASLMYSNDFDDAALSFPYAGTWSTSCPGCGANTVFENAEMGPWWTDRLMPYTKNKGIFANPTNTDTVYLDKGYQLPGLDLKDSQTAIAAIKANQPIPANLAAEMYRVTYTFNEFVSHGDANPTAPGAASMTGIPQPSSTVLLGPSDNWFNRSSCHPNSSGGVDLTWDVSTGGFGYELWGADDDGANMQNGGFNGGANFGFTDGHAKYSRLSVGDDAGIGTDGTSPGAIGYVGYFPQAATNPNVAGVTSCPTTYSDARLVSWEF